MKAYLRSGVAAIAVLMVASCAQYNALNTEIGKKSDEAANVVKDAEAPHQAVDVRHVRISDGFWFGNKVIDSDNGDPLPADLPYGDLIDINSPKVAVDLRVICSEITAQTGLKCDVEDTIFVPKGAAAQARAPESMDSHGISSVKNLSPRMSGEMLPTLKRRKLKDVLNVVASYEGIDWEYIRRERRIRLFAYETKIYDLDYLPTHVSAHMQMGSNGHGGTNGGQSNTSSTQTQGAAALGAWQAASLTQDADLKIDYKPVEDAENLLKDIAGVNANVEIKGPKVVSTGPRYMLRKIKSAVDDLNEWSHRQVAISFKVYKVTALKATQAGVDFNAAFTNVAGAVSSGATSVTPAAIGQAAGLSFAVLPTTSGGKATKWANSSVTLQALETLGKTQLANEGTIPVKNGRLGFYGDELAQDYVYSEGQNLVANVGSQSTVTPATLETGFTMQVTPFINKSGIISLSFTTSLSDPSPFRNAGPTGAQIELGTVATNKELVDVDVASGDYLILGGFAKTTNQTSGSSLPGAEPGIGGSMSATGERDYIVVLVQPVIITARGQ